MTTYAEININLWLHKLRQKSQNMVRIKTKYDNTVSGQINMNVVFDTQGLSGSEKVLRLLTFLVVAFEGPRLALAAVQEHLHATPHQVFPARTHGTVEGSLVHNLNQFT